MGEIVNLGDCMDNYTIVIDGENPHAELLKNAVMPRNAAILKLTWKSMRNLKSWDFQKFPPKRYGVSKTRSNGAFINEAST
jgi:hypothetical protein